MENFWDAVPRLDGGDGNLRRDSELGSSYPVVSVLRRVPGLSRRREVRSGPRGSMSLTGFSYSSSRTCSPNLNPRGGRGDFLK